MHKNIVKISALCPMTFGNNRCYTMCSKNFQKNRICFSADLKGELLWLKKRKVM